MEPITQQSGLNSWDNYTSGTFIKASDVVSENDPFICISIEEINSTDRVTNQPKLVLRITLERNGKDYEMDLNKTNASKLKELGIKTPKETIGKKIYFKKALVRDPVKKVEVEGLRIYKIE